MIRLGIVGTNYGRTVQLPALRADARCQVVALAGRDAGHTATPGSAEGYRVQRPMDAARRSHSQAAWSDFASELARPLAPRDRQPKRASNSSWRRRRQRSKGYFAGEIAPGGLLTSVNAAF